MHITIGLAFMLCWPLFRYKIYMTKETDIFVISCMMIELFSYYCSSGSQGAVVAALVPAVNIVKMLLIGLGIMKDEATVKSMTRFGDYRYLNYFLHCIYGLILVGFMDSASLYSLGYVYILSFPDPTSIWKPLGLWCTCKDPCGHRGSPAMTPGHLGISRCA